MLRYILVFFYFGWVTDFHLIFLKYFGKLVLIFVILVVRGALFLSATLLGGTYDALHKILFPNGQGEEVQ
jgi:hypothetical protein